MNPRSESRAKISWQKGKPVMLLELTDPEFTTATNIGEAIGVAIRVLVNALIQSINNPQPENRIINPFEA